ncbi:MAG: hypothetical protein AAGF67_15340 [Verrucomicrobiota bacterium]
MTTAWALEPSANAELVLEEDFAETSLAEGWTIQNGTWIPSNGVLVGTEVAADNHTASARRALETKDAIYELKFRFSEGSEAFHLGFDPVRSDLKKKGHLYSVMITDKLWRILKHVDKNHPQKDPSEVLAQERHSLEPGTWYHLRVTSSGETVTAQIEGLQKLEGSHPTFSVRKPALIFRVRGQGVCIDDLKVWRMKK